MMSTRFGAVRELDISAQHLTGAFVGYGVPGDRQSTIDEDLSNTVGVLVGVLERAAIYDGVRIE